MDFFDLVAKENNRSLLKFGKQQNSLPEWVCILMEEVGELSKEVVEIHFKDRYPGLMTPDKQRLIDELIQVASVCLSMYKNII